tara:strand:- start:209 stop:871 length:663 start_codon:yes stop_codon:yes gene_type:complete
MSSNLKSLYKKEDHKFLTECVKLCYDGMKHLDDWNYQRTLFFDKLPKNMRIAEVGVHAGKNAYRIYNVCKPSQLCLIDPWTDIYKNAKQTQNVNLDEQENCKACCEMYFKDKENVNLVMKFSIEASNMYEDNSFDVVYIDADHSYECLLEDLSVWSKKIKINGYLGGHDYRKKPANFACKSVADFLSTNPNFRLHYEPPSHLWGVGSSDGHYDFLLKRIY